MTKLQDDNYAFIPHPTNREVLLLAVDDCWTLPRLEGRDELGPYEARDIQQAIWAQLGLEITVLDALHPRFENERKEKHIVYATENHSPHWSPPENARWIGRDGLAGLSLSVPEHRAVLEAWFDEVEHGDIPYKRVPWARPGWFDQATTWIERELVSQGYNIVAPIEQVHVRVWSTILRVST